MCHLILFLPVFALPVFWVLPLESALLVYLFILAISLLLYFKVFQAMHQHVQSGREGMLKKKVMVIEDIDPEGKVQYFGQIWSATGAGKNFRSGDEVIIKAFRGLSLIVDKQP